jgi:thiamine monophosphate synthase
LCLKFRRETGGIAVRKVLSIAGSDCSGVDGIAVASAVVVSMDVAGTARELKKMFAECRL